MTGNNPSPAEFPADNEVGCVDVTIGPGEYTNKEVSELVSLGAIGDCTGGGLFSTMATGEIESGQTETCTFRNV